MSSCDVLKMGDFKYTLKFALHYLESPIKKLRFNHAKMCLWDFFFPANLLVLLDMSRVIKNNIANIKKIKKIAGPPNKLILFNGYDLASST